MREEQQNSQTEDVMKIMENFRGWNTHMFRLAAEKLKEACDGNRWQSTALLYGLSPHHVPCSQKKPTYSPTHAGHVHAVVRNANEDV